MSRLPPAASSDPQTWSPAAQPLPVQPLGYSEGDDIGAWRTVSRAAAWAAIAMGVTQLLMSLGNTWGPAAQMLWSSPASRSSFFGMGWQPYLVVQVALDAAAVMLIVAGANAFLRRPWVPMAASIAAATLGATRIASAGLQLYQMLSNPSFARAMPGGRELYYVLNSLSSAAHGLILPALLVWIMTRPAVRQYFRGLRMD